MTISSWLSEIYGRDKLLFRVGLYHFILAILLILPLLLDQRLVTGINPWIKPIKFALSIGIYAWTIGWYISYLRPNTKWVGRLSLGIAISMIVEMLIIVNQAARGVQSHYNETSLLNGVLFGLMGLFIAINTLLAIIIFIHFIRKKFDMDVVYLNSLRVGLAIFIFAGYAGGMMITNGAHSIGVEDGGAGLPFINWSTEGGDLRAAHFFGLHALQIFPLLTFWIQKQFSFEVKTRMIILLLTTLAFLGFLGSVWIEALNGNSFLSI